MNYSKLLHQAVDNEMTYKENEKDLSIENYDTAVKDKDEKNVSSLGVTLGLNNSKKKLDFTRIDKWHLDDSSMAIKNKEIIKRIIIKSSIEQVEVK